jgi:AraC-like DNA-binding protein
MPERTIQKQFIRRRNVAKGEFNFFRVLDFVTEHPNYTNIEISKSLGLSTKTVARHLKYAYDCAILRSEVKSFKGFTGHWIRERILVRIDNAISESKKRSKINVVTRFGLTIADSGYLEDLQ